MSKAQLENGYTKIANQILDTLCVINLGAYESRVLNCIIRKTYGYNKKEDWIANSQIVEITKLHKAHVSRALKKLTERKIVTRIDNKTKINTTTSSWLPVQVTRKQLPVEATLLPVKVTTVTRKGNDLLPVEAETKEKKYNTTKDNYQKKTPSKGKHLPKENELSQADFEQIAERYNAPVSFVLSKWEDVHNYCYGNNKRYSDYKRVLSAWVKKDALKLRKEQRDRQQKNIAYIPTE